MTNEPRRIVTNLPGLAEAARLEGRLEFIDSSTNGAVRFLAKCARSDLVIVNIDAKKLMLCCALKWIAPWLRFRIVSVDLILRTPRSFKASVIAAFKKLLFKKVSRFILFFTNVEGYERFYGVGRDRVEYVRFKVNSWEQIQHQPANNSEGDYVLCAGRTLRDIRTFVEAMKIAGCPAVLLQQNRELLRGNGTELWSGSLPANVRLVFDEANEPETFIHYLANARIVAIPRFKHDIAPSGISTYLLAMALNRCVVISEGPGADDVLTDEAVIVPAEDAHALASEVESLWCDAALRNAVATRGKDYANRAQGEARLFRDILRASLAHSSVSEDARRIAVESRA